jgi:hypothetical protein
MTATPPTVPVSFTGNATVRGSVMWFCSISPGAVIQRISFVRNR